MKMQRGFTLIELIIVIVILGILSVTAAPQFFNFGGDARTSTLRGLQGSMNASADLVYARAAIEGIEREPTEELTLNGTPVPLAYGYPHFTAAASPDAGVAALLAVLNIAPGDWEYSYAAAGELRIAPPGRNGDVVQATLGSIESCFVSYSPATSVSQRPVITVQPDGC
ncbi:MAG: prepilin-type N-terminal cleavage/methylation domain-containing protein [Idiomarina sp.]|nr:prepilin-type N-terminal cleavage/methylation domain-containing protein [Idiomarina sp.]